MLSSSTLLKQTHAKVVVPKKPSMKSVFSGNIKSSNHNNNNKTKTNKMVKAHSKSRDELKAMKVKELKAMVKDHNPHNQIKGYTTMKKGGLIDALMQHSSAKDVGLKPLSEKELLKKHGGFLAEHQKAEGKKKRGRPKKVVETPPAKRKLMPLTNTMRGKGPGRPKKRIAPTLVSTDTGKSSPMKGKGKGSSTFEDAVSNIAKKATKMDKSKKGKKLISNTPVKKSKEPKTKNNYRTGRNFV